VPLAPEGPTEWNARFRRADLRIVTGSRTLLEALEVGGPFLYYNGIVGRGRSRRRHRPEKIAALLEAWRSEGVGESVVRDLENFAAGRSVARVVQRAASDPSFARGFPDAWKPRGWRPPFGDAGQFLLHVAEAWATAAGGAPALAETLRSEGRRAIAARPRRSVL